MVLHSTSSEAWGRVEKKFNISQGPSVHEDFIVEPGTVPSASVQYGIQVHAPSCEVRSFSRWRNCRLERW